MILELIVKVKKVLYDKRCFKLMEVKILENKSKVPLNNIILVKGEIKEQIFDGDILGLKAQLKYDTKEGYILEASECNKVKDSKESELYRLINDICSSEMIDKVNKRYGEESVNVLRNNPYILIEDNVDFEITDKIAKKLNIQLRDERIEGAIMHVINESVKEGHFYIEIGELRSKIEELVGELEWLEEGLNSLVVKSKLAIEDDRVYRKDYNVCEDFIVQNIKERIKVKSRKFLATQKIEKYINEYEQEYKIKLTSEQKEAIISALKERVSIITGGPGTGKTEILKAINYVCKKIDSKSKIMFGAPTGKAASKMKELGLEAQTIHRIFGMNVQNDKGDYLAHLNYLILDETTMIDAYLFNIILNNIDYTCKIILVGDVNQIPAIGVGAIFRDLIDCKLIKVTKLKKTHRFSDEIRENCEKVLKGIGIGEGIQDGKTFRFIEANSYDEIKENLKQVLQDKKCDIDDTMILTCKNKNTLGSKELNDFVKRDILGKIDEIGICDRVMQTQNNYQIDVMNGQVGVVAKKNNKNGSISLEVDFGDRKIVYTEEYMHQLQLAYSITIHKSQGSQFKNIILVINDIDLSMLDVSCIYTALTRAKENVVIIGNKDVFNKAIKCRDNLKRRSYICEKLKQELSMHKAI